MGPVLDSPEAPPWLSRPARSTGRLSSLRVESGDVRAFVEIVVGAGEGNDIRPTKDQGPLPKMNQPIQIAKAETFRKLHDGSKLLVLPNAWDVASARLYEAAGFSAIATTSAGVAWTLGYPDGENISRQTMLEAVQKITGRVSLPVTADMVAGFGPRPEDTAETVQGVIAAGAVGINLEDGTGDPHNPLVEVSLHVEKIRAAREAATAAGVPVVINARTDVFLAAVGAPDTRLDHAIRRANAYREAGADCTLRPRRPGFRDDRPPGTVDRRPAQRFGPRGHTSHLRACPARSGTRQRRLRPDAGGPGPAPANRGRAAGDRDVRGHDGGSDLLCRHERPAQSDICP